MVMTGTRPDLAAGLSEHRRFLVRLAALQLGSAADADDVVQDTFAAAIAGQAGCRVLEHLVEILASFDGLDDLGDGGVLDAGCACVGAGSRGHLLADQYAAVLGNRRGAAVGIGEFHAGTRRSDDDFTLPQDVACLQ